MLQQTQVGRVVEKYQSFLAQFPTIDILAATPLSEVIKSWSGLGYNRRARYLHEAVKQLSRASEPWSIEDLSVCKGIGYNTAAAVLVYAYNQAVPFIETNVRTVLIHHFMADAEKVDDKILLKYMESVLDHEHPREFMWAMMDYGNYLKSAVGNLSRQSKHYTKQSTFVGSKRQLRGEILRQLAAGHKTKSELQTVITDERLEEILTALEVDGLIVHMSDDFRLAT